MQNVKDLIIAFQGILKLLLPIAVGVALLGFFWGLAMFIFQSGDENKVDEGKRIMKWGLVALFVMVSVWGIVQFMMTAFGLQGGGVVQIKTL